MSDNIQSIDGINYYLLVDFAFQGTGYSRQNAVRQVIKDSIASIKGLL